MKIEFNEAAYIIEAYNKLPVEIKAKLLYNGNGIFTQNGIVVAKLVAAFREDENGNTVPKTSGPRIVQFMTYAGKDKNGYDAEKGIVVMPGGSAILNHPHETDSEFYQEVTEGGLIVNGEPQKTTVCKPGEEHGAEASPEWRVVAWEWHEDGTNLDFTPQVFNSPNQSAKKQHVVE